MESKQEVTHTGLISKVAKKGIKVKIGVLAGCSHCQLKGSCNMVEQSDDELFIECDPSPFKTGQQVTVSLKSARGTSSMFMSFIIPFIILISSMSVASLFFKNEAIIGIVSLILLLLYFSIYYLFRNRIKKKLKYTVTPYSEKSK
jgi:sigma-E factor negative regulatory protein RseC